jgi:hypothetical protein
MDGSIGESRKGASESEEMEGRGDPGVLWLWLSLEDDSKECKMGESNVSDANREVGWPE